MGSKVGEEEWQRQAAGSAVELEYWRKKKTKTAVEEEGKKVSNVCYAI